jgi:phosphate transport system substrate-binding protein
MVMGAVHPTSSCWCQQSSVARAVLVVLVLALAACEQATLATPTPVIITIAGSTSMQPVLYDLTTEYSRQHPTVRFDLAGGGSTVGEERVWAGQVDLGASTLTATATPTTTVGTALPPLLRIPIGLDGLAIVVHASNPISGLTTTELQGLYSGRIFDWAELGGESGEVILISREDGSGSRATFEERVMNDEAVSLTAVVMPTSADVVAYVVRNPNAIGYLSRAYVVDLIDGAMPNGNGSTTTLAVRVVPLDGDLPTPTAIREGGYGLTQPLLLLSRGEPQGAVRAFVDFTLSSAGQAIVERHHVRIR